MRPNRYITEAVRKGKPPAKTAKSALRVRLKTRLRSERSAVRIGPGALGFCTPRAPRASRSVQRLVVDGVQHPPATAERFRQAPRGQVAVSTSDRRRRREPICFSSGTARSAESSITSTASAPSPISGCRSRR
jgi:hypothetical protein